MFAFSMIRYSKVNSRNGLIMLKTLQRALNVCGDALIMYLRQRKCRQKQMKRLKNWASLFICCDRGSA